MVGGQLNGLAHMVVHIGSKHNISLTVQPQYAARPRTMDSVGRGRGDKEGGRRGVAAERRRHGHRAYASYIE